MHGPWLIDIHSASSVVSSLPRRQIKGPDNPTSQLLPILSNKCCSGDGEGRKDKGGGGGSRSKTSCVWRVVCDKVVCERWCVAKKDGAQRPTRPSPALLHEAHERHHCAMQSALQRSPHASVTRKCHKHCQVSNVTKNRNMTIEIKRRKLHPPWKGVNNIISKQKRLDNIARPKLLRTPCWRRYFFTATHCSSHILKDMYNHISSRNISCPQGISLTAMRTAPLSSRVTSSRCLAAMRATCKESGHAKKHAETSKHRLHKVSFYDRTAKTSSLFALCASSNSKRAGTVSSSANLYKACLISSHGGSKSKHDTSLHELSVTTHVFPRWVNNARSQNRKESLCIWIYSNFYACWIASQISRKAGLFQGKTLPSSTTGTRS